MKIAVPVSSINKIDDHYSHCEFYAIYTISEQKEIVDVKTLHLTKDVLVKTDISNIFETEGVTVLLAGGIGITAIKELNKSKIDVVSGCSGNPTEVVKMYISGHIENIISNSKNDEIHYGDGFICN